jgi:hypothetical protein
METAEQELLDLKHAALDASARCDAEFYRRYLADDAVAVTPAGITDKQGVVASAKNGGFRSIAVQDTKVVVLDQDAGMVTYRATFATDSGNRDVFVSTVYRRRNGTWQGVLYQQTPLPPTT